jgi:uncharacterized membrane protein YdjX (TVP38/TMEM64 family)
LLYSMTVSLSGFILSVSSKQRLILVIALALLIPIVPFAIIGELPGERWLSASDEQALVFGLTGMALLAADVLLPIPSSIVGTLLGARLGFWVGFAATFTGLMVGNLIGYGVGRWWFSRLRAVAPDAPTLALLFISRPVPVFAEALVIAAGATRVNFVRVIATCAAGNLIYAAVLAGSGAAFIPSGWAAPGLAVPMLLPPMAWYGWRRFIPRP